MSKPFPDGCLSEHLSVHYDDDAALEALVHYVDDHWDDAMLPKDNADSDPFDRVNAWITATRGFFIIAEASIDDMRT